MRRVILPAVMAWIVLASASAGMAQTKKVTRKSGPPLIGTVTQKDEMYEVVTPVGAISIPAEEVVSITDYVTFEEQYSRRVLALEPGDAEGRYRLAQWCMGEKKLKQARDELLAALKIKPDHQNARLLLQLVEEELADEAKPRPTTPDGREMIPGTTVPLSEMVSGEDVMRIRLAELRSHDRVSIAFRDRADVRFADQMKGIGPFADPAYRDVFLLGKPAVAKAVEILVTLPDATELHRDVLVRTNPQFMSRFKTRIWPMIAANCASAQCHGGVKGAGRLRLYNVRSRADTVYFTNFLILDAFESSRGRMIDRSHPSRSLLLQFGLAADEARATHPGEIRSMYRGVDDRRYRMVETWIKDDLIHPHPKYDIRYRIPGGRLEPILVPPAGVTPPTEPAPSRQPLQPDAVSGNGG